MTVPFILDRLSVEHRAERVHPGFSAISERAIREAVKRLAIRA